MNHQRMMNGLLITILLSGLNIAQADVGTIPVRPANFRLDVQANRLEFVDRDVLRITVTALNNGEQQLQIVPDLPEIVEPVDLDAGKIIPSRMDGVAVNAIVLPEEKPLVIGSARLIPLQRPWMKNPAGNDATTVVQREYKLPLFGSAVVQPHSTRIISTIRILLTAPVEVEPQLAANTAETVEDVDVAGRWIIPWPGEYLLDCTIDKIAGAPAAQAQTLIRIAHHKPLPQPVAVIGLDEQKNLLVEYKNILTQIREQLQKADGKQNSLLAYARLHGKYLHTILRVLLGTKPDQPTDPGADPAPAVTAEPAIREAAIRR